jgi:hypothetical protein
MAATPRDAAVWTTVAKRSPESTKTNLRQRLTRHRPRPPADPGRAADEEGDAVT